MASGQVEARHAVVACGDTGHRVDAVRVLAQRNAECLECQCDIAQGELSAGLGDPKWHRLVPNGQERLDWANFKLALFPTAGGDREHRRRANDLAPPFHSILPQQGPASLAASHELQPAASARRSSPATCTQPAELKATPAGGAPFPRLACAAARAFRMHRCASFERPKSRAWSIESGE